MDPIDRQAIHDKVTARYPDSDATQYSIGYADAINDVLKDIRYLPSAQKTGRWIRRTIPSTLGYYEYECGECGHIWQYGELLGWNYCPSCGCRMECEEK